MMHNINKATKGAPKNKTNKLHKLCKINR